VKSYRAGIIETAEKKYLNELMNFCAGDVDQAATYQVSSVPGSINC
jgi:hypothetical protein